jgi:Uma2 family endonuclease
MGAAMSSQGATLLTPEEYLEIERRAERKSEYFEGQMFAMAGASHAHIMIVGNLGREVGNQLKGGPCREYASEMRLRVAPNGLYTYPDLMVICGGPQFVDNRTDTVVNPVLIIEVLSESTEAYDRGKKFEQYRKLASLREYVMVAQDEPHIEQYVRQSDGHWLLAETSGIDASLQFASINCVLPISEVYYGVAWPPS